MLPSVTLHIRDFLPVGRVPSGKTLVDNAYVKFICIFIFIFIFIFFNSLQFTGSTT